MDISLAGRRQRKAEGVHICFTLAITSFPSCASTMCFGK